MLKRSAIKRIIVASLALVIMFLFYLFPRTDELSIPEEVIYVDEIFLPIYAAQKNGYVARSSVIKNDKNEDDIKYLIDMLTIDSQKSLLLPNNFTAVIPPDTKVIDYTIEDKILKINFTKEFLNVREYNEEKMIEALTYSLVELDGVKGIMIYVENSLLDHYPNSGKRLPKILDRNLGINKSYDIYDIKDTKMTTTYYIGKDNDNYYYIPISKITNEKIEPLEIIVNELKTTPIYETNLISYLNASYELKSYQILENSISLSFDNEIIAGLSDKDINEQIVYTLSLSIRDTYDIDKVDISIN